MSYVDVTLIATATAASRRWDGESLVDSLFSWHAFGSVSLETWAVTVGRYSRE
jgi:hypothetical protein